MCTNKELALQLQDLLGPECMVRAWLVDYAHPAISIRKGDKEMRIFTKHLVRVQRSNGLYEYTDKENT